MDDEPGKYYPICGRCGEDMKSHQHIPGPGVCSDCYAIYDMARFMEYRTKREEEWYDCKKEK